MDSFRVTIISFRDVTVQAESLAAARDWAENREGNSIFSDPSHWEVHDVCPNEGEEAFWEVHPDGTYTPIPEEL